MSDVVGATRRLLSRAVDEAGADARDELTAALSRLEGPLAVAVAGRVKTGKSTLVNAMLGQAVAPTDEAECTRVVTWYHDGPQYHVEVVGTDGRAEPRPFRHGANAIDVDLGRRFDEVARIDVWLPSRRLREQSLIDTPGLASASEEVSARSIEFLADEDHPADADAVIYLLRHLHTSDARFLEAFHGSDLAQGSPVNAVGVLSRADEIGLSRMDALEVAERVAARYRSSPALSTLCPVILPVAGLLAAAGALLQEDEYAALARLAAEPLDVTIGRLITADDFMEGTGPIDRTLRARILERLGLFGTRLGVHLVRSGQAPSSTVLAGILEARSGILELRAVLRSEFLERSQLLKARSALATLEVVINGHGIADGDELARGVEELRAGAHEFEEIRLLHLIRSGGVRASEGQLAELERLLGGQGHDARRRLGVSQDSVVDDVRGAANDAVARWQRVSEHPVSSPTLRQVARGAKRAAEAMLAGEIVSVGVLEAPPGG